MTKPLDECIRLTTHQVRMAYEAGLYAGLERIETVVERWESLVNQPKCIERMCLDLRHEITATRARHGLSGQGVTVPSGHSNRVCLAMEALRSVAHDRSVPLTVVMDSMGLCSSLCKELLGEIQDEMTEETGGK